jgi:hypothetical protein
MPDIDPSSNIISEVMEAAPLASVADTVKVVGPAPEVGLALPVPMVGPDWQNKAAGVNASMATRVSWPALGCRLLRSMRFLPAYCGGAVTVSVMVAGVAPPAGATTRELPAALTLAPLSSVICTP